MFNKIKNNKENRFFTVKDEDILRAENAMGILIPETLKQFYNEVGYGFLETKGYNINRVMDPKSVEKFRNMEGDFACSEMAEVLKDYAADKLVFFEANETVYFSIGITKKNKGRIYYYDTAIAENLEVFLEKYMEDESYYVEEQ